MPRKHLVIAICLALLHAPVCAAAEGDTRGPLLPPVPSLTGLSGLVRMPTAESFDDGTACVVYSPAVHNARLSRGVGRPTSSAWTVSLLPGLELSLTLGTLAVGRDAGGHAKLRVRREQDGWPALSVGIADAKRNGDAGSTAFAVATKHLAHDRLGVSLGYAHRGWRGPLAGWIGPRRNISGVFGGWSYQIGTVVRLLEEHDTRRLNYGAVIFPHPGTFLKVMDCDVGTLYSAGVQFDMAWPRRRPHPPSPAAGLAPLGGSLVERAQQELAAMGLEEVQASLEDAGEGDCLAAGFENRLYTLNDLDAAAAALRILSACAGPNARELCARVKHRGIPLLEIRVPADAYRKHASGEISRAALAAQTRTRLCPASAPRGIVRHSSAITNRSLLQSDLALGIGLETKIGTEAYQVGTGWHLRPELSVPLGHGLAANVRTSYPIWGQLTEGVPRRLLLNRAVAGYAFRVAPGVLGQVAAGRFSPDWAGQAVEVAGPIGRHGLLRAVGVWYKDWDSRPVQAYQGEYWHALPHWNVRARLFGGRFLWQDTGIGLDLTRDFGEMQMTVGARGTTIGRTLTLRLMVPLGPARQRSKPGAIRLRPADFVDYRSATDTRRARADITTWTAEELPLGGIGLVETMLNRGRLTPEDAAAHLP